MHCPSAISPLRTIPEPSALEHAVSWVTDSRVTHRLSEGWRLGEGGRGRGPQPESLRRTEGPRQERDTRVGFGWGPDVRHSEASILLELQTSPFQGIHISAGFAVTSELFNFT